MANPPNSAYNSGGVPHGGMFVNIYRPADPENPNNAPGTLLGRYLLESCNPSSAGNLVIRPDVDAGENGWFITKGPFQGQAVIQRNTSVTPTVENGDYFDAALRVSDAGALVGERFVIHTPDYAKDAGYRKQSVTVIRDKHAGGGNPIVITDDNTP